jgi:hypothetical protein
MADTTGLARDCGGLYPEAGCWCEWLHGTMHEARMYRACTCLPTTSTSTTLFRHEEHEPRHALPAATEAQIHQKLTASCADNLTKRKATKSVSMSSLFAKMDTEWQEEENNSAGLL